MRLHSSFVALVSIGALALAGCGDSTGPGSRTGCRGGAGAGAQEIAFSVDAPGGHTLYRTEVDGVRLTRLHDPVPEMGDWSPDGTRIAFTAQVGSAVAVQTVEADGSDLRTLVTFPNASSPRWAPDCRRIAFTVASPGKFNLYVVGPDGSGLTSLLEMRDQGIAGTAPDWSPDGKRIAVTQDDFFRAYMVVAEADGSGFRVLPGRGSDREPQWSPDGRQLAFISYRTGGRGLFVMAADGSGLRTLIEDFGDLGHHPPSFHWSPDGTRIVAPVGAQLRVVDVATGTATLLAGMDGVRYSKPRWSPDGRRIASVQQMTSVQAQSLIVMNADGSGVRRPQVPTNFRIVSIRWRPR